MRCLACGYSLSVIISIPENENSLLPMIFCDDPIWNIYSSIILDFVYIQNYHE